MAQHILIESLLCNVPITWATLQEPSIPTHGQSLSLPLPQNQNKWVHPVIFKQQPNIKLTQSSYKVTSFLDFQPFLGSFQAVNQYLEDFKKDLNNPNTFRNLFLKTYQCMSLLCWMNPLSIITSTQNYVDLTPSLVLQSLKLNSIN